eukprot:10396050-Karenia_brevis.AAC.1
MLGKLQRGQIRKTDKQSRTESTEAMHSVALWMLIQGVTSGQKATWSSHRQFELLGRIFTEE